MFRLMPNCPGALAQLETPFHGPPCWLACSSSSGCFARLDAAVLVVEAADSGPASFSAISWVVASAVVLAAEAGDSAVMMAAVEAADLAVSGAVIRAAVVRRATGSKMIEATWKTC